MKLQLLIPQFNENDDVVSPMLSSIKTQQGINLKNDIEVLIGNDGSECKLSENLLGSFPFPIRYFHFEHTGRAGTRKQLFELATADYVMFCDADDMFLSNIALYSIFPFMQEGYDAIVCDFLEEKIDEAGRTCFIQHRKDGSFVHGKTYRRQFLLDNTIVWYPGFEFHEDATYNILAISLAKRVKFLDSPLYLWKWREGSVSRQPLFHVKTLTRIIFSNAQLVKDFLNRGMVDKARYYACYLVYLIYYRINEPVWFEAGNEQYRYDAEKCFQQYYKKHRDLIQGIAPDLEKHIMFKVQKKREEVLSRQGLIVQQIPFDDWIKHIEELVYAW